MVHELLALAILGLPVACVAWTVTHEEIFREIRERFQKATADTTLPAWARKLAYMPTCEYCFSHYVALLCLHLTPVRLFSAGWPGFLLSWFALVWIANLYMNLHFRLRLSIRLAGAEAKHVERMVRL